MQYKALLVPTVKSTVPLISLALWPAQQSSLAIIAPRYCVFTVHTHTKRINLSFHFYNAIIEVESFTTTVPERAMISSSPGDLVTQTIHKQWFRPILVTYVTQIVPKQWFHPILVTYVTQTVPKQWFRPFLATSSHQPYLNVQWFLPVLATYFTSNVPEHAMISSSPGDLRHTNRT
jgi:hypothetical protein